MYNLIFKPNASKEEFYGELLIQMKAVIDGQRYWVTNLSNASALIYHGLNTLSFFHPDKAVNWAGFYIREQRKSGSIDAAADVANVNHLVLGPFQGKVACTKIKYGRGVCGTAASTGVTQMVTNVHEFPGHIACDSDSMSEIVLPLIHPTTGEVLGVLDIDDVAPAAFDQRDKEGLEKIVTLLVHGCDWDF